MSLENLIKTFQSDLKKYEEILPTLIGEREISSCKEHIEFLKKLIKSGESLSKELEVTFEDCCLRCANEKYEKLLAEGKWPYGWQTPEGMRMWVCKICGNKRCPHSDDHRNVCSNSNEPGQPGSRYPGWK